MSKLKCDWCGKIIAGRISYKTVGHFYHLDCNTERLLGDANYNIKHDNFEVDTSIENAKIEVSKGSPQ